MFFSKPIMKWKLYCTDTLNKSGISVRAAMNYLIFTEEKWLIVAIIIKNDL